MQSEGDRVNIVGWAAIIFWLGILGAIIAMGWLKNLIVTFLLLTFISVVGVAIMYLLDKLGLGPDDKYELEADSSSSDGGPDLRVVRDDDEHSGSGS